MDDEDELELVDEADDDIDELFGWAGNVYESTESTPNDFTCTIESGTITSVSDGQTTITLT